MTFSVIIQKPECQWTVKYEVGDILGKSRPSQCSFSSDVFSAHPSLFLMLYFLLSLLSLISEFCVLPLTIKWKFLFSITWIWALRSTKEAYFTQVLWLEHDFQGPDIMPDWWLLFSCVWQIRESWRPSCSRDVTGPLISLQHWFWLEPLTNNTSYSQGWVLRVSLSYLNYLRTSLTLTFSLYWWEMEAQRDEIICFISPQLINDKAFCNNTRNTIAW